MSAAGIIKNVAIVGATGRLGGYLANEIVKSGKHDVIALTRGSSNDKMPKGVNSVAVDYESEESVVNALKGRELLIITLQATAPPGTQERIISAAGTAGVKYIIPNCWGYDYVHDFNRESDNLGTTARGVMKAVEAAGCTWIMPVCGYWYEWSVAAGEQWFGFDIKNKKVTLYDDGKQVVNTSTWIQCGRAIAALLRLPESGASPSIQDWANKAYPFASFRVSQRDILDSLHRVLGDSDADWEILHEDTVQRQKDGRAELAKGDMRGFAKLIYARVFEPTGESDYESKRGIVNEKVGLRKEDLDEATKRTVQMVEDGWTPFGTRA